MEKSTLRVFVAIALISAGLSVGACANPEQQSQMASISSQEAGERALKTMGVDGDSTGSIIDTTLEKNGDISYYSVRAQKGGTEYYFDMDALTGVVIETNYVDEGAKVTERTKVAKGVEVAEGTEVTKEPEVLVEEIDQYGENTPQETASDVPLEEAKEGSSAEEAAAPEGGLFDMDGCISEEKALAMVFERVPGSSFANITSFEKEYDDGAFEYEGELLYEGMEYEFEIDAYSGHFREWKAEYCDD